MLVNLYSGQIKISDFGTSKRLVELHAETTSFRGTCTCSSTAISVTCKDDFEFTMTGLLICRLWKKDPFTSPVYAAWLAKR